MLYKGKLILIGMMLSGACLAETQAEWAAKWQGIQGGVPMTNYYGEASWKGAVLDPATKASLIQKVEAMSASEVWAGLMERDGTYVRGKPIKVSAYGSCYGYDQGSDHLFLIDGHHGTNHHSGYPKNPASGDSTGYTTACFNEHIVTGVCRSGNWQEQAKQTLLLALRNDACTSFGKLELKTTTEVSILDSENIYYVSPDDYCANGKPLCGTTMFGSAQGDYASFNQLPEKFCRASYGVLEKSMATNMAKGGGAAKGGRFITCDQLSQKKLKSDLLKQAKSVMSSLNDRLYVIDLPFSGYTEEKLKAMKDAELALFLASMDSNPALIRIEELKVRAIALSPEIKAQGKLEYDKLVEALKKSVAEGNLRPTYSLEQAIAYIEKGNR